MTKVETKLMETLSMTLFGKKYQWRKLVNKGVMTVEMDGDRQVLRRTKLTKAQAQSFMIKKIEAIQEKNRKAQEAIDESNKQSDTSERDNDDTGSGS